MSKLTTAQIRQVLKELRSYCTSNATEYGGTEYDITKSYVMYE